MANWYTADWHLGHFAVLRPDFDNRPFRTIEEHNWELVRRTNAVVSPGDVLWLLGDVGFMRPDAIADYLRHVKCQINIVKGNHDRWKSIPNSRVAWTGPYRRIKDGDDSVILFHFPIESWHGQSRGAWHLHGHTHGNLTRCMYRRHDVGCMNWDYYPVSLAQVKEAQEKRDPNAENAPTDYQHLPYHLRPTRENFERSRTRSDAGQIFTPPKIRS